MDCLLTAICRISANVSCYRYLNQNMFRKLVSETEEGNRNRRENYRHEGRILLISIFYYFQVTYKGIQSF